MTTDSDDGADPTAGQTQSHGAERQQFESSMREFAEGASALAAASIRMQMMMLEQTREMFSAFSEMDASAEKRDETKS